LALARRLPFSLKPEGLAQPLPGSKAPVAMLLKPPQGPEGRYNLDLVGHQNLATLGCVSPSGLAVHGMLQPVVTTTGRGYASPSGLRKPKDFYLALSPEGWHTLCRGRRPRQQGSSNRHRPGGPIQPGFSWPSKSSEPWVCRNTRFHSSLFCSGGEILAIAVFAVGIPRNTG
jgi:hypothetical protein